MRSPAAERPASLWGQQTRRSAGGGTHRPSGHPSRDAAPAARAQGRLPLRFIEEKSSFEYGQVNHALAAAMRTLLKEYLILVTQLEQLQRQACCLCRSSGSTSSQPCAPWTSWPL